MRLYEHSQTENASTRTIAIDEKKKKKQKAHNRRNYIIQGQAWLPCRERYS